MLSFACFSPHAPIFLPSVGSEEDRLKVKDTIAALEFLGRKLKEIRPDALVISSPHPDWGFNVPLHFLMSKLRTQNSKLQFKTQDYQNPDNVMIEPSGRSVIYPILTTLDSAHKHYEWGKAFYLRIKNLKLKIVLVASGDMSHCLKADGPYGFHPDGPAFDKALVDLLKKKDIENSLKLDELYPEAGECGLRSFSFLLGILDEAKIDWRPEILSYEGPFGVGYLTANFHIR